MNLFNLLCISEPSTNEKLLIMILPILLCISLSFGLINICENLKERKNNNKANKKFKRGIYCTIFAAILLTISFSIIILGKDTFYDTCKSIGSIYKYFRHMSYNALITVPLILIVKTIFTIIKKKNTNKKEKVNTYAIMVIAILIMYYVFILLDIVVTTQNENKNDEHWTTCWCD